MPSVLEFKILLYIAFSTHLFFRKINEELNSPGHDIYFFDVRQPLSKYRLTSRPHRESVKHKEHKISRMVSSGGTSTHCWILYAFVQEMVSRICWKVEQSP